MGESPHPVDPFATDLRGKYRPAPVLPGPHGLMTNVDAALGQEVIKVPHRRGYFTYIMTTRRMTSGGELKYRNGLFGLGHAVQIMPLLIGGNFL